MKYIAPSEFPYFPALLGSTLRVKASALLDYCATHPVEIPPAVKEFFLKDTLHAYTEPVPTWHVSQWYAFARTFKKCKHGVKDTANQAVLVQIMDMMAVALELKTPPLRAKKSTKPKTE